MVVAWMPCDAQHRSSRPAIREGRRKEANPKLTSSYGTEVSVANLILRLGMSRTEIEAKLPPRHELKRLEGTTSDWYLWLRWGKSPMEVEQVASLTFEQGRLVQIQKNWPTIEGSEALQLIKSLYESLAPLSHDGFLRADLALSKQEDLRAGSYHFHQTSIQIWVGSREISISAEEEKEPPYKARVNIHEIVRK